MDEDQVTALTDKIAGLAEADQIIGVLCMQNALGVDEYYRMRQLEELTRIRAALETIARETASAGDSRRSKYVFGAW